MSSTLIGNTMGEDKISSPKQRRDIMKFYSEVTKKLYDTPELVKEAEDKAKAEEERASKLKETRAERAKEVTDAYDRFVSLREAFLKDYGSFHMTYHRNSKDGDAKIETPTSLSELVESIINIIQR